MGSQSQTQLSDFHASHRGFPQDQTPPPEQRGLSVGAGLEGGQVQRGCVLSSPGAPDGTWHPGGRPEVGGRRLLVSQVSVGRSQAAGGS